jgi:hypothetical protein
MLNLTQTVAEELYESSGVCFQELWFLSPENNPRGDGVE